MSEPLPEITEVQRLRLEPGDILVIRSPQSLTPDDAQMVQQRVRVILRLPEDFPLLVLPGGMSVEAVSA